MYSQLSWRQYSPEILHKYSTCVNSVSHWCHCFIGKYEDTLPVCLPTTQAFLVETAYSVLKHVIYNSLAGQYLFIPEPRLLNYVADHSGEFVAREKSTTNLLTRGLRLHSPAPI